MPIASQLLARYTTAREDNESARSTTCEVVPYTAGFVLSATGFFTRLDTTSPTASRLCIQNEPIKAQARKRHLVAQIEETKV